MTPAPQVSVRRLGREGQPLVVIDNASGQPEALLARGRSAQFQDGGASYPGIRAWCPPDYLERVRPLLFQALQQVFGFRRGVSMDVSTYSIVTTPEADLAPLQRIPHYDHADGEVIAVMHYLLGPESGGTAFYRHCRTGFETIDEARVDAYRAGLAEDEREYGMPPARYHVGSSERFEEIGRVEAQVDRLVLYRGRLLHSGVIPDPAGLTSDPAHGRLTINMFMRGR
ncbi:DUF6445 family protein [Aurantiacibacter luteus]|uniref:DUF6445 family protein n=1 Tax=Aurantiacibacter luteus TaxID=1581420 RepID=UPI000AB33710|nr:DUF6445 family protein [Aurantiacibacter luteus]